MAFASGQEAELSRSAVSSHWPPGPFGLDHSLAVSSYSTEQFAATFVHLKAQRVTSVPGFTCSSRVSQEHHDDIF